MTITIFGATGIVGKYLVKYALAAGHKVIAFGRNIEKLIDVDLNNDHLVAVKGYVFDEKDVHHAIQGSDVVLSALGGSFDGVDKTRSLGIKNIITQMQQLPVKRIIAIGGMGVLNADENSLILDAPDYPTQYLPVGKEHLQAFKFLQSSSLDWTFVCPPTIIDEEANDNYVTAENYHPPSGSKLVSAGNIAHFILKELETDNFLLRRVGIANAPL